MLEDDFNDILSKAAHGLSLDNPSLAAATNLAELQIEATLKGKSNNPSVIPSLASALGLDPEATLRISRNDYQPIASLPSGVEQITTDYSFMRVHAYLIYDKHSREAIIIDSGASAAPIIQALAQHNLTPVQLLLTHNHPDHIAGIDGLREKFPTLPIAYPEGENYQHGTPFTPGTEFNIGSITLKSLPTRGHTPAGVSFFCKDLEIPVAFCGDAIFAGSIGGPKVDYQLSLGDVRANLLSLPGNTVLAPGHGPLTTVEQELANNPFFTSNPGT